VSYLTYALLIENREFSRRARGAINEQSNAFLGDRDLAVAALARDLLRVNPAPLQTMLHAICAGPGFDEAADVGDGTIDQSLISDEEIRSQTQVMFPRVASLFYDNKGVPIP
jgi:hypothetical protein